MLLIIPCRELLLPLLTEDSERTIIFLFDNTWFDELGHQVCRYLSLLQFFLHHLNLLHQDLIIIKPCSILLLLNHSCLFFICNLLLCSSSLAIILNERVGFTLWFYINFIILVKMISSIYLLLIFVDYLKALAISLHIETPRPFLSTMRPFLTFIWLLIHFTNGSPITVAHTFAIQYLGVLGSSITGWGR